MGNINITGEADSRLETMAKQDNRNKSNMVQHLIHEEFRSRRVVKSESNNKAVK